MFWRNYGRNSLWREMDRLQRDMNRLFDRASTGSTSTGSFPPINIWADEERAVVTAELPGVAPDDLEVSLVADTLTLSGERSPEAVNGDLQYHRRERWRGTFSRTIQLPFRIDGDNVDATFSNGVIQVTLPRAETDRPKRISLND